MKKLTIEHLAAYLPYGVKIIRPDMRTILTLSGISGECIHFQEQGGETYGSVGLARMILRPLSDLTREITQNGETFVPMDKLLHSKFMSWKKVITVDLPQIEQFGYSLVIICAADGIDRVIDSISIRNGIITQADFTVMSQLHSWHFDTFGLIDAGLAIDINTVTK